MLWRGKDESGNAVGRLQATIEFCASILVLKYLKLVPVTRQRYKLVHVPALYFSEKIRLRLRESLEEGMLNADKLPKDVRTEWGLKTVPAIQYFDQDGARQEHYDALGTIASVAEHIGEMAEKYGLVLEEGEESPSLDLRYVAEAPSKLSERKPVNARLIRADSQAGAISAETRTPSR